MVTDMICKICDEPPHECTTVTTGICVKCGHEGHHCDPVVAKPKGDWITTWQGSAHQAPPECDSCGKQLGPTEQSCCASKDGRSCMVMEAAAGRGDWFCTASGRKVHILDPQTEDINIPDIAHALANTCRFGGHVNHFYSVAQHSVHVSMNVPERWAKEALLHDAAEAYLGDVISPLKQYLGEYLVIEKLWEDVIAKKFDLDQGDAVSSMVKEADLRALITERRDVAPRAWADHLWKLDELGYEPFDETLRPQLPQLAEAMFLARWGQVCGG